MQAMADLRAIIISIGVRDIICGYGATYHMRVPVRIYASTARPGPAIKMFFPEDKNSPLPRYE